MIKYLDMNDAIHYLMEENAGEVLICKMLKEFFDNPYSLVPEQDLKQWLNSEEEVDGERRTK